MRHLAEDLPGEFVSTVLSDSRRIAVEGDAYDVPAGGVVRVAPEVVRSLRNGTGEGTHVRLAFGAPPVGTVEDFGSYVVADERD